MKRSGLSQVVRFEIVRTLKRASFWVAALLLPALLVGYIAVAGMSGSGAEGAITERAELAGQKIGLYDEAKRIHPDLLEDVTILEAAEAGRTMVEDGELDVAYVVPTDLAIRIYYRGGTTSFLTDYRSKLDGWLHASTLATLTPEQQVILTQAYTGENVNLATTDAARDIGNLVAPLVGLVVFYVLIVMFGNRLSQSTIEEKEGRISEMLLTACSARTLIVGKMIALILLGFLQVVLLAVPVIAAYVVMQADLLGDLLGALPVIQLSAGTVAASLVLLLASYVLFTGLCMFIGTLVPTAREVSQYSGIVIIGVILPIFFIGDYLAATPSLTAQVLTFFPLSAPISLFARLALGTIPMWQFWLGVGGIVVMAWLMIVLTVRTFQLGLMEFSRKLRLGEILRRKGEKTTGI
jgi:ABC-2 type transport system permease protein